MSYLLIRNDGVAPVESFTLLGASTARGDATKIGQFGSGAKHGILTLLRMGIDPIIYLGTQKLTFYTEQTSMGGKTFNQVCYKIGNKKEKLSYTLEFGALDWQHVHMGLREFISNAIDAGGEELKIVESATPHAGKTNIYIETTPDILSYYRNISKYFLHFDKQESVKLLHKKEISPCRIYRKGVFVRELQKPSIYDYNFGSEVEIDESRNMDEYGCLYQVRDIFTNHHPELAFDFFDNPNMSVLESEPDTDNCWRSATKDSYLKLWIENYGSKTVAANSSHGAMLGFAKNAGYEVKILPDRWYSFIKSCGVQTIVNFGENVQEGCEVVAAPQSMLDKAAKVWKALEVFGLTKSKQCPPVYAFRNIMAGGTTTGGFYKDGKVFINMEYETAIKVYIEEFGHYITGAKDATRDFQDWAFNLAGRVLEFAM